MNPRFRLVAPLLLLAACSRQAVPPSAATAAPASAATPAATAAIEGMQPIAGQDPAAPLAVSDVDAYVTGATREIEWLQDHADALARARAANDGVAEAAALAALASMQVQQNGARAAGLELARYRAVKGRIEEVLVRAEMAVAVQPQIEAAEKADLSALTTEQRQQHEAGLAQMRATRDAPYATLPAATAQAIKARRTELAQRHLDVTALRLRVARH